MSKSFSDSAPPSTELLRKYRDGTLSAEEAQRLEDLRAQDPFVADALDGTSVAPDGHAFAEGVTEVQHRLRQRTRPRRSVMAYSLRVAASLVILLGVGYLYHYTLSPSPMTSEPKRVASSRPAPVERVAPTTPAPSAPTVGESPSALALAPVEEESVPSPSLARSASATKKSLSLRPSSGAPVASNPPALTEVAPAEGADSELTSGSSPLSRSRRTTSHAAERVSPMIKGRVIDEDTQEPLPGVNVLVKGTSTGTLTDIDGRFSLPRTEEQPSVVASFIGYAPTETLVQQPDSVLITLVPDVSSLSEVVVTGYGRAEEYSPPTATTARPVEGRRAFRAYLQKALRSPPDGEAKRRVVKVTLTVQPDGSLTDFAVKKSAGAWYDREAIRVIQAGPVWKAATQAGTPVAKTVTVTVPFDR